MSDEVHAIILASLARLEEKVDKNQIQLVELSVKFKTWGAIMGGIFGSVSAGLITLLTR
jgi:hypothetical protein